MSLPVLIVISIVTVKGKETITKIVETLPSHMTSVISQVYCKLMGQVNMFNNTDMNVYPLKMFRSINDL